MPGVQGGASAEVGGDAGLLGARVATLESEVRRSKRREEKLQAMQFRLREDLKACGGDLSCAPPCFLLFKSIFIREGLHATRARPPSSGKLD